jgi:hypothetical protein
MVTTLRIILGSLLLSAFMFSSGCIVAEPHDGYYDQNHHRYYREHRWHECGEHDGYCR